MGRKRSSAVRRLQDARAPNEHGLEQSRARGPAQRSSAAQPRSGPRWLLRTLSLSSVLFYALHQLYVVLSDWMHGYVPPTDPALVNPWLRHWVKEHDGVETYVMLAAVAAFLLAGAAAARWAHRIPWFPWWPAQLACVVPALTVLAGIRSTNFTPLDSGSGALVALGAGVIGTGGLALWIAQRRPWVGRGLLALGFLVLAALVLLGAGPAQPFDYGFFVGPARKLAQGEPLGSFYLQYNLVGTYAFRAMMALGLRLHEMQAVLGVLFTAWVGLYLWLARRLIESRALVALFVMALLVVRWVAVGGGPTIVPQISQIRMDLWVLPVLALERFGFTSRVTALAFALCYVADNVFGFLFFGFYACALVAALAADWKAGRRPTPARLAGLWAPLAAAVLFQLWAFGAVTNPAAKLYQNVHLGFLPISLDSMFWGVAWVLLWAIAPIAGDPDDKRRRVSLFLFAVAAGQLLYFYGRSHDHNLLHVAGVWLLPLFLGLDRLRQHGVHRAVAPSAAAALVCLALLAAGHRAKEKLDSAWSRVARGVLIEPVELDRHIAAAPAAFDAYRAEPKVFLFDRDDAYVNYRYGLPQVGYFAPFMASVFIESTAEFIRQLLLDGYKVLVIREHAMVFGLNGTKLMLERRQQFTIRGEGPVFELALVEDAPR